MEQQPHLSRAKEWLVTSGELLNGASERHHVAAAFGGTGHLFSVGRVSLVNTHTTLPVVVRPNGDSHRAQVLPAGTSRESTGGEVEYLEFVNTSGSTLPAGSIIAAGTAYRRQQA